MADFEFDASDLPDVDVARDDADDDTPLDDFTHVDDGTPLDDFTHVDAAAGGDAETSFITPAGVRRAADAEGLSLEQQVLATAVNAYYDALAEQGITPSLGRDINNFELDGDGRLRLKAHPDINIVNTRTGRPNSFGYIAGNWKGGGEIVKQELSFSDWKPGAGKQKLPPKAAAALSNANQQLGKGASNIETVPLRDLGQGASDAIATAEKIITVLTRKGLTPREILGMCRALERSRGELVNNEAKLSELKKHLALERRKFDEAPDEATKTLIAERITKLEDEIAVRREIASATREALRSQISRIRETINRILNEDTTLGERIRTLFSREQGITIVSILTAISMTISTIVLALKAALGGGGAAESRASRSCLFSPR